MIGKPMRPSRPAQRGGPGDASTAHPSIQLKRNLSFKERQPAPSAAQASQQDGRGLEASDGIADEVKDAEDVGGQQFPHVSQPTVASPQADPLQQGRASQNGAGPSTQVEAQDTAAVSHNGVGLDRAASVAQQAAPSVENPQVEERNQQDSTSVAASPTDNR